MLDEKIVYDVRVVGNKVIATIKDEHNVKYTKEIRQDELRIEPTPKDEMEPDDIDNIPDDVLLADDNGDSILNYFLKN